MQNKKLTSKQKKYLKSFGHGLKPLIRVGKNMVGDSFINMMDKTLTKHELVKISVLSNVSENKQEIQDMIEARTNSVKVQSIGRMSLFFRQNKEDSKFELPASDSE